ncbi:MAG: vanadium-dependent haloperoxidase [Pseudomonadota bacterium]
MRMLIVLLASFTTWACAAQPTDRALDVAAWNRALLETADAEDGFLTLKGVRTAALMHIAMHETWRLAQGLSGYGFCLPPDEPTDPARAAATAADAIATPAYPDARDRFGRLAGPRADEVYWARNCAVGIVASHLGDGWNRQVEYAWQAPAPGVYADFHEHSGTPEGFVFGRGWAEVRPMVLTEIPRVPAPPAIDSDAYARAWDEVRRLGAAESAERADDQAHLAMWWKDFAERSFNRLARDQIATSDIDTDDQLRLFALLNTALFDAYIAAFDNKYHYNHWRPYTAIRAAEDDGNEKTAADPAWDNLHGHTYAFPSYPSAHGTVCGAAAAVFEAIFGEDYAFRMVTATVDSAGPMSEPLAMQPPYRDFDSFDAAARECALSRVYLGIHFRYDSDEGYRLGKQVGRTVTAKR